MRNNTILYSDTYKDSHWLMYPDNMVNMYSYIESRGSDLSFMKGNVVMFGLQAILKKYFVGQRVTKEQVEQAKRFTDLHIKPGVFNYEGWKYIVEEHDGYLPLRIKGLKEGTVLPWLNAMVTVESTDPKCAWLVSYFEPILLQIWYPITVATLSYEVKQILKQYWISTVDDDKQDGIEFAFHDFGLRGASSVESAEMGCMGHILNFLGTDTKNGIAAAYDFYNLDQEDPNSMPAFSVIASEHTAMCTNSDIVELDDWRAAEKLVSVLEDQGPGTIVSVVADTYDVYRFADEYIGTRLKQRIIDSGGRLVLRPDSGDPKVVPIEIIEILLERFGYVINSKGYKVLPDCIRVLQGDGVNAESIREILEILERKEISAENIVFGVGGALLQHCDRDWLRFAMKGSAWQSDDGKWHDICKMPKTDSRKVSKRGRLTTYKDESGKYFTDRIELQDVVNSSENQMITYFENGKLVYEETFLDIRNRLKSQS